MNSMIDIFMITREQSQSFNNSMVISISLFLIIMIIVITVENLLYKIENQLVASDSTNDFAIKIIIWSVELIAINLIFFSLGSFFFSSITNSYYIVYQLAFVLNLIFTLLKFSLKLYYLVRGES